VPILKARGDCRKVILGPLSRYWKGPCCGDRLHHLNYNEQNYLKRLGNAVFCVLDNLKVASFNKRIRRLRVLCPNCFIIMRERTDEPSLDELRVTGESGPPRRGSIHKMISDGFSCEMEKSASIYTNSGGGSDPDIIYC
jgi:hypothetical protein